MGHGLSDVEKVYTLCATTAVKGLFGKLTNIFYIYQLYELKNIHWFCSVVVITFGYVN